MQSFSIFKTFVKRVNYFGDHSSLHGMRHVFSSKPIPFIRRSVWSVFVSISVLGMVYILHQATDLFENQAISFVPETTYLNWDTDFPAVTICEIVDNQKLRDYYDENDIQPSLSTFHKEIIFVDTQHYCRECVLCDEELKCPTDFFQMLKKYRAPCNETVVRCSWRDTTFECCERFMSILTEYGECFVFNSAQFGGERMHVSNKLTGPGYLKFTSMETVMIDVHSPDDIIFSNFDKPVINKEGDLPFASEFELRLKVEDISNEPSVEHINTRLRGCLFPHEFPNDGRLYPRYSYSTCIVHCRAVRQLNTCNCTHHMLPRIKNEPICGIKGLVCLTNLAEVSDDLDEDCDCLPSCVEPSYDIVFVKNKPNAGALTDELIERGTLISISLELLPSTRVQRLVVRSSLDHVVFIGGTAGIFFGASILSLLEIIYLMFIRKYT